MRNNAESVADVVVGQGTGHVFTLMGDGNMHLVLALAAAGVEVVEVRHESAAVAMAEGYGWSSGKVGICTVTHGPGLTHTATSLVVAARNRSPLVVLAGETPTGYQGAQAFGQRALVEACEAGYVPVTAGDDAGAVVAAAIAQARQERRPVVVAIPADLLHEQPGPNAPVAPQAPEIFIPEPAPDVVAQLVADLSAASRPVLLAGRGVGEAGCSDLIRKLAERFGAGLATTLPAKGLFEGHPLDLGVAGGLTHPDAEPVFYNADLVVAFGSGVGGSTTRYGRLFPSARLICNDVRARPQRQDRTTIQADAAALLTDLLMVLEIELGPQAPRTPWFPPVRPWPECWNDELESFSPDLEEGTLDPRRAVIALDAELPQDAIVVIANGHCSGFASALVRTGAPRELHLAQGFGSIGQGLTTAIGVALGAGDRPVVVFEGDAAFMMHAQELDTAVRAGARLTAIVFNDQALGTEYHRLARESAAAAMAVVPTPAVADVAEVLGAYGVSSGDLETVAESVRSALAHRTSVVELRTSRAIESRHLRWRHLPEPEVAHV